ncbi:MAG: hypothetical protein HYS13_05745 [Planctomycetia bacterium]|nr:hypothetical protein [Planctomycetia bacterium]
MSNRLLSLIRRQSRAVIACELCVAAGLVGIAVWYQSLPKVIELDDWRGMPVTELEKRIGKIACPRVVDVTGAQDQLYGRVRWVLRNEMKVTATPLRVTEVSVVGWRYNTMVWIYDGKVVDGVMFTDDVRF